MAIRNWYMAFPKTKKDILESVSMKEGDGRTENKTCAAKKKMSFCRRFAFFYPV